MLASPTSNVGDNSRTSAVNRTAVSWLGATKRRRISLLFVELGPFTFTVIVTFYVGLCFFDRGKIFCCFCAFVSHVRFSINCAVLKNWHGNRLRNPNIIRLMFVFAGEGKMKE